MEEWTMNLSDSRFFGPQAFVSVVNLDQIPATRYGYESGADLHDVCVLSRPVGDVRVYCKTNGRIVPAGPIHQKVATRYGIAL